MSGDGLIHEFPRIYRTSATHRALQASGGVVIGAGAVIGAVLTLDAPSDRTLILLLCACFFVGGLVLIRGAIRDRVVLHADAIELHEIGSGTQRMERSRIRGFRRGPVKFGVTSLHFIPKRPSVEKLQLPRHLVTDEAFGEWLAAIPELDAQDQRRSMADFVDGHGDGLTRAELEVRLANAKRQERIVTGLTWLLSLTGTFLPSFPPALGLALALLPLLATLLQAMGRGAFTIDTPLNDVRANLGIAYILPPMVLLFRCYRDTRLLDHQPLFWLGGMATLALVTFALLAIPGLRRRIGQVLLMLLFMGGHSFAAVALSNMYFDRGPVSNYTAEVRGLYESDRKRRTTYHIGVSRWGPDGSPTVIRVNRPLYRQLKEGGEVCVDLHQGAFGARWFMPRVCQ